VSIVGHSPKNAYPNRPAKTTSVYLNGASEDSSAHWKALNMKNCIKFAPIPSAASRQNCWAEGVSHVKNKNGTEHVVMMMAYSKMKWIVDEIREIFLMIMSCNANNNVVKMGMKMNKFIVDSVGEKKKQSPLNPRIVAIMDDADALSFSKKMDRISMKNGMVQKMTVTSDNGKILTEYMHPRKDKKPRKPRNMLSRMSVFEGCFGKKPSFLNKKYGDIVDAENANLKNNISIGCKLLPSNFVIASKSGPIDKNANVKNTPCLYPRCKNQFIAIKNIRENFNFLLINLEEKNEILSEIF